MIPTSIVKEVSSSRVEGLRQRIIEAPREVCVERARYFTQSMSQNWEAPPLTRMSKSFAAVLKKMSVIIRDDELIVGCRTSKLKGAPLFPENKARWIEIDVDTFGERALQRVLITEAEQRELKDEILPFWNGRTVEERLEELLPSDVAEDMDRYIFTMVLEITYGVGHFTMDHSRVLSEGLKGIINDAEKRLQALGEEAQQSDKGLFLEAVIRSLKAAIQLAHRYADRAAEMAFEESDSRRAQELEAIADICRRVPEEGARTFHEAVQALYFIHLLAQIESGGNSISLGRIDQVLYPYFQADIEAKRITAEQAQELISLLFLKTNEIWNILEEAFIPGGEGTEGKTTQNVTIGGVGPDGEDRTNELSHLTLQAYAAVRTVQPNLSVRLSPDVPKPFFMKALGYAQEGVLLHLFNDPTVVKALVKSGHSLEDARDYGLVGCVEPNAQGKTFGSTFAVQFSAIKCLELALSNGVDNIFGFQVGPESGEPADFDSFDEVWQAYQYQVSHFMKQMARGMAALDQAIAELVPSPFASAMIQGPLEQGLDLTRGGAKYNSTGVQFQGFANVADSLYAIKKAVFEEQVMSMEALAQYLAEDWENGEDKRLYMLKKIPKYGTDHDGVDAMAAKVLEHLCQEAGQHENYRGGPFWPGIFSVGFHIAMGAFSAASADGRYAGDVLANGGTPTNGNALKGPTAVINSITKLPLELLYNGINLNLRFNPAQLDRERLWALISTYFQKGGIQVQFNMVDSNTLRAAQAEPESHRDLVVRVSGYSALFTQLSEIAQDEIISRTEYLL